MRAITVAEGLRDLTGWLTAEARAIEQVRQLNGGGGWEKWCVIQFLRWQLAAQPPGLALDYQRELQYQSGRIRRYYDIAYNYHSVDAAAGHPLILTQWKTGNDGNSVSTEVTADLGTLVEVHKTPNVMPVVVVLCAQPVAFPGYATLGPIPHTSVQLYHSTDETWQMVGGFRR